MFVSRLCREILNSCIRNTESAEEGMRKGGATDVSGRGLGKGVWGMIEDSVLAKSLKEKDGRSVCVEEICLVSMLTSMCTSLLM